MKKKHIVYTLFTIPLTIALGNVNDSNAFFGLDSFISRNKAVSDVVNIRDNNLLKAINNQLGRGEVLDSVTIADMERLTTLNAQERDIFSIEGLEYAINLRTLYLYNNKISDISSLGNLTSLNKLYLYNNRISDISSLGNLTSLNALSLYSNQISDISDINNLTNLTYLQLANNQISDILALSNLFKLKELYLDNNQISNISPLRNLTNLNILCLGYGDSSGNNIKDVSPIENLVNLKKLYLQNNKIEDISILNNLTNLTHLYLNNNQISNIPSLSNLTNLTYLDISNNQISDISSINNLTNLNTLYLNNNQISDISPIRNLKNLTKLNLSNQKPIIEIGDFKSEANEFNVFIDNPIMGLNNKVSNITNISNNGLFEKGRLKWNDVSLGNHTRKFNFSENVIVGSATTTFNGTATLNFNVVEGGASEINHTSEFDNNDFCIYTTVTVEDFGVGADYLIHKGVRQSLPYKFKYDILESTNNTVEVYDLAGNKAEYQVKLKDSDIPSIEEGLNALVNKASIEKEDISYFRKIINDLDESMNKDLLQDRLNDVYPNALELERKSVTSNVDVYIKSENILQMALDTNSITFEDFSGIEDMVKENAVNISINSSLPYQLNAYLPVEIQNSDKSNTMDKDILNIKENSEDIYQTFTNTIDKIILKDNCSAGNDLVHGVDIKLKDGIAHQKDVYKTTIKFEAEQK